MFSYRKTSSNPLTLNPLSPTIQLGVGIGGQGDSAIRSGPSHCLRRPLTRTCIQRAPPPSLVRGWTSPLTSYANTELLQTLPLIHFAARARAILAVFRCYSCIAMHERQQCCRFSKKYKLERSDCGVSRTTASAVEPLPEGGVWGGVIGRQLPFFKKYRLTKACAVATEGVWGILSPVETA